MLDRSTFLDLVTTLAAAPSGHARAAASTILAVEMTARRTMNGRRNQDAPAVHPVFVDLPVVMPTSLNLAALLGSSKAADASLAAAKFYLHADRCPSGLGYVLPGLETASAAPYRAVIGSVERAAAELRGQVIADMGLPAFTAARVPYDLHAARWSSRVTAIFGVLGSAAPGAGFRLHTRYVRRPGYSVVGGAEAPSISVPAVGTYRFALQCTASSAGMSNPTDVEVALDVGGVEVASYTSTRASSNAAHCVEVGDYREFLLDGQASTFEVANPASTVTVRNSSAHAETIGGLLVMWRG
ncbi:MAG: hypothetical protein RLZZ450_3101 [Pseudomonadota bacterium]|jgi:hypothetical protein